MPNQLDVISVLFFCKKSLLARHAFALFERTTSKIMMLAHLQGLYLEIFLGGVCVCVKLEQVYLPLSLCMDVFVLMVHSNYPIRLLNSQCYTSDLHYLWASGPQLCKSSIDIHAIT